MRNLTLGVLIVSGGTLAAIPFRRLPSADNSLDAVVRATGPTTTPLNAPPMELQVFESASQTTVLAAGYPWLVPTPATEPVDRRRYIEMPIAYDDTQVPIETPASIAEKFTATSPYQQAASEQRRRNDYAAVTGQHPSGHLAAGHLAAGQLAAGDLLPAQRIGVPLTGAAAGPDPFAAPGLAPQRYESFQFADPSANFAESTSPALAGSPTTGSPTAGSPTALAPLTLRNEQVGSTGLGAPPDQTLRGLASHGSVTGPDRTTTAGFVAPPRSATRELVPNPGSGLVPEPELPAPTETERQKFWIRQPSS